MFPTTFLSNSLIKSSNIIHKYFQNMVFYLKFYKNPKKGNLLLVYFLKHFLNIFFIIVAWNSPSIIFTTCPDEDAKDKRLSGVNQWRPFTLTDTVRCNWQLKTFHVNYIFPCPPPSRVAMVMCHLAYSTCLTPGSVEPREAAAGVGPQSI